MTATIVSREQAPLKAAPAMPAGDIARLHVRPCLPRDPGSVWGRAAAERDRIFETLQRVSGEILPDALIVRSNPGLYPVTVGLECWIGVPGCTERVRVVITVTPRPHHRFPLEYRVLVEDRGRGAKTLNFGTFDDQTIEHMLSVLASGEKWKESQHRIRTDPWQLIFPKNRVINITPDYVRWAARGALATAVLGALLSFGSAWRALDASVLTMAYPAIVLVGATIAWKLYATSKARKWATAAIVIGLLVLQPGASIVREGIWTIMSQDDDGSSAINNGDVSVDDQGSSSGAPFVLVGSLLLWAGLRGYDRRRVTLVYNEGRPATEPRNLRVADYWSTVIDGLGSEAEIARARLLAALAVPPHPDVRCATEAIVALGPDGEEEREQLVLSFRRTLVFVHLYAYGANLYVGWDAHLNHGQWAESEVARGMKGFRKAISVRSVDPTWERVSEYDVHDLNCLIEWTHVRVVRVIRQLIAEHRVDQEVDFKIQRVERDRLLDAGRDEKSAKTVAQRILRTG